MAKKEKNRKNKQGKNGFIDLLPWALVGAVLGTSIGLSGMDSLGILLLYLGWAIAMAFVVDKLQTALHEGGHLIFGLLTGYRFVSYRVGSWMVQRENGKLRWHRYKLPGTAGQCLMAPPEMKNGTMPYKLYNLGGVIANLLTALIAAVLVLLCGDMWAVKIFFAELCVMGLYDAWNNGVPKRTGGVDNDGANVQYLSNDPVALRIFWVDLSIAAKQAEGVNLLQMPKEWFVMPTEGLDNARIASQAVNCIKRMMGEGRDWEAIWAIDALRAQQTALTSAERQMLLEDRIRCGLFVGEETASLWKLWNSEEMQEYRRQGKDSIDVLSMEYVMAVLVEKNPAKAEAFRAKFEQKAKTYPYAQAVVGCRKQMQWAWKKSVGQA